MSAKKRRGAEEIPKGGAGEEAELSSAEVLRRKRTGYFDFLNTKIYDILSKAKRALDIPGRFERKG